MRRARPGLLAALAGLMLAACAPPLAPVPRLVAVWPSPGSTLPVEPQTFELTFNRPLVAEASWAAIWRDEDGAPIATQAVVESSDPRQLQVHLLEPTSGDYRLRWHAVAATSNATATADGEQYFSLQDESDGAPRLRLSRTTAESGESVRVLGSGFGDDSPVQLTIGDDGQELTTVQTDDQGGFAADAKIPPNVPFGMQPVTAVDVWGDAATAALEVRWGGWPPLVAVVTGQPGPRSGEVTFWLTARNRSDYLLEHVRIVMADPDRAMFVAAEPKPIREGRALVWELPTQDRGTVGPFHATYRVPFDAVAKVTVEFRHRRPHGCTGDDCLPAFVSLSRAESAVVYPAE